MPLAGRHHTGNAIVRSAHIGAGLTMNHRGVGAGRYPVQSCCIMYVDIVEPTGSASGWPRIPQLPAQVAGLLRLDRLQHGFAAPACPQ